MFSFLASYHVYQVNDNGQCSGDGLMSRWYKGYQGICYLSDLRWPDGGQRNPNMNTEIVQSGLLFWYEGLWWQVEASGKEGAAGAVQPLAGGVWSAEYPSGTTGGRWSALGSAARIAAAAATDHCSSVQGAAARTERAGSLTSSGLGGSWWWI